MRHGLTLLTDQSWARSRPCWIAAEQMGFSHAWTYDHLVWGGLPDSPWFGGIPVLTAAAGVTTRIALGTAVCAPNFRHPLALYRDAQAVQDIAQGRFVLGVGTGGDLDAGVLGEPPLTVAERVDRFQEFTDLLLRLRSQDQVDAQGRWFSARQARTLPLMPDLPVVVAGNGPRSVRYAARNGDGWMTLGPGADSLEEWFDGLARLRKVFDEEIDLAGRPKDSVRSYLMLDAPTIRPGVPFSLSSVGTYARMAAGAEELGFTDVITHWPRAQGPYQGSVRVLEEVAARFTLLPG